MPPPPRAEPRHLPLPPPGYHRFNFDQFPNDTKLIGRPLCARNYQESSRIENIFPSKRGFRDFSSARIDALPPPIDRRESRCIRWTVNSEYLFSFFFFYALISRVPPPRIWNRGKRGDASLFDLREIRRNMEYMGGGGSIQNRRGSKEIDGDDRRPLLFFEWNWNIFYIRTIDLSSMERHYFQFIKNWNSTVIKVIVFNKRIRKLNEYNFSLFKFLQNKRNEKKKRYSSNIS